MKVKLLVRFWPDSLRITLAMRLMSMMPPPSGSLSATLLNQLRPIQQKKPEKKAPRALK